MIDGVMCYRTSPRGLFEPYTLKDLSARYAQIKDELAKATRVDE